MRSMTVCLGIALAALVAGCGKSDDQGKRPALPVPQCEGVAEDAAKNFARLIHAMDNNGEIEALNASFRQHRKALEKALAARDPSLPQKLKPVLDERFSDATLRARAACAFAGLSGAKGVALLDEWSRQPEMRAINNAIWTRKPTPSEDEDEPMTSARGAKLRDIATAMALQQIQANRDVVASGEAAALVAALDAPTAQIASQSAKAPVALENVVDAWLTPALVKTPDDELDDFLGFVEGPFGADFYVALATAYDFRHGPWYATLYEKLRDATAAGELPEGSPGKDAVIADARRLLREIASPAAAADALARLQPVERIDPRNPEVHALLAEALIKSAPAMPLGPDQLRVVIETPQYEQAEKHLLKAIELAPEQADSHVWLGRLRWLQGRDAEATEAYQQAAQLNPEHPSLNLNLGDLMFTAPDYSKAVRYYLAATAKPEGLPFVHYFAMAHLQMALRKNNRIADYPRYAEAYLAKHPDAWNVRLDYADYLMSTPMRADRIIATVTPVPDDWAPQRKTPVLSAALIRKASERVDKRSREPVGEGLTAFNRALALNPDPRTLAEAVCRANVDLTVAQAAIAAGTDPKAISSALVVCGLRWQRVDYLRAITPNADAVALSRPQPELLGDTPLCYAAGTKNVKAFNALAKLQVNPVQKCNDGNTVAERLARMAYGGDAGIAQMQNIMNRFYRKS